MKKILAIALAAVMVLGLATSALAVSWAAPAASTTASPFAVEVIKLGVNSDITGAAYYTVLNEAAAYDYSTIYYAIKLSLPSIADANAYYGNSGFVNGNEVKVTITWTNVAGKSTQTVMVPLTTSAQTLWFDGSNFTAAWQQSLKTSCGCGESHILSAVANGTKEVSVKACVGAEGKLSDVTIGGCYSVASKKYYGIVPCVNCKPQNLSGYLFSGDCTANDIFFSTNSAAKVTGAYVVDKVYDDIYYGGTVNAFEDKLYGWQIVGTENVGCVTGDCTLIPKFDRVELPYYARVLSTNMLDTNNAQTVAWVRNGANSAWVTAPAAFANDAAELEALFAQWVSQLKKTDLVNTSVFDTFTKKDNSFSPATKTYVGAQNTDYYAKNAYDDTPNAGAVTEDEKKPITITTEINGGQALTDVNVNPWNGTKTLMSAYKYDAATVSYVYGDTYAVKAATSDSRLFQQTSATTVNCDTNEASYLNSLNHLYSLLGFTYADIAAGNVYMNDKILLANFGFSTSICDTATWGAYTAAITVAPVTEVPATGVASFAGFAMIAIAGAAAAVARKRD